jgi:hypothetical protein
MIAFDTMAPDATHADADGDELGRTIWRQGTVEAIANALELLVSQARRGAPPGRLPGAAAVVGVLDRCRFSEGELAAIERYLRLRREGHLLPSTP